MLGTAYRRALSWFTKLVPAALLGVAARVLVDTLHLPGYFDSLGAMLASSLGPVPALLTGFLSGAVLSAYYPVYLLAFWIPGVAGAVYTLLKARDRSVLGGLLAALAYVMGWAVVYSLVTGTWNRIPIYLATRGAMILALDVLCSAAIGGEVLAPLAPRLSDARAAAGICLAVMAVTGVAYASVRQNEWGVTQAFPERDRWVKVHTKMDLVWIWMGEKGINNYYHPETRFTRGDPGYQVWVGLYWIQGRHDVHDVSLVSEFAVWDQNFWNGIHGVPDPYTYVVDVHNITEFEFKGYRAYLMYGGMITPSDVEPYEEVWIEGFFITFYDEELDITAIIYACATKENLPVMLDELWDLVNSWTLFPG